MAFDGERTSAGDMTNAEAVKQKIENALAADFVDVIDNSDGCGAKFQITVVSEKFSGKGLVDCHRMVYDALKEEMPSIHAISITAKAPDQWKEK